MKEPFHTKGKWIRVGFIGLFSVVALGLGSEKWWEHSQRKNLLKASYAPAPEGMVFVPPGEFLRGSDEPDADPDERPLRKVFLPGFYIDRHEVTNREYREFDQNHSYPEGADEFPVSRVLRHEAAAYARALGKRLPTGAEWEKAARGTTGWIYPWGNDFNADLCNVGGGGGAVCEPGEETVTMLTNVFLRGKMAVHVFPAGASPYGCLNMSGNVWEWVGDDWVDRDGWGRRTGMRRGVIRGGAYGYSSKQARASYQGFEGLETTCNDVGFRCVKEALIR